MKRIVPQFYIDRVEDARQDLLKLAEDWKLNDNQMAQLHALVTDSMFQLSNRKFKDYRFDRRASNKAGHRLGIAKHALEAIKKANTGPVLKNAEECLVECRDMARQTLEEIENL